MLCTHHKNQAIAQINSYFQAHQSAHNNQALLLLTKVDPMLVGLYMTPMVLKRIRLEFKSYLKNIATDFGEYLNMTIRQNQIQPSDILNLARNALKCHQKIILNHFLTYLQTKNPNIAESLKEDLEQFTDVVMLTTRKNNAEVFSTL